MLLQTTKRESAFLRLEVKRSFPALSIERHRCMFVSHHPSPVNFAKADRDSNPSAIISFAALHLSAYSIEAMTKRNLIPCGNGHLAYLVPNRSFNRFEHLLPLSAIRLSTDVLKRRRDVKNRNVRRVVFHHPIQIPRAQCVDPFFGEPPDHPFFINLSCSSLHCCSPSFRLFL